MFVFITYSRDGRVALRCYGPFKTYNDAHEAVPDGVGYTIFEVESPPAESTNNPGGEGG